MINDSYKFRPPSLSFSAKVSDFKDIDQELRGIYVFRGKYGDCLYIGQTKSFRRRLANHLASSPFSRLIHTADLFATEDPLIREIFETIFINEMKPRFNRAKSFNRDRSLHDFYFYEISKLEDDIQTLEEELFDIKDAVDRPICDLFSYDEFADIFTDPDEEITHKLGEDLRHVYRIPEIEVEIRRLKTETREIYRKLT